MPLGHGPYGDAFLSGGGGGGNNFGLSLTDADFARLEFCRWRDACVTGGHLFYRLVRQRIHFHIHTHVDGKAHLHAHSHAGEAKTTAILPMIIPIIIKHRGGLCWWGLCMVRPVRLVC